MVLFFNPVDFFNLYDRYGKELRVLSIYYKYGMH